MSKGKLFNFIVDEATSEAIDKLAAALSNSPGDLTSASKSRAVRKAIHEAVARLEKDKDNGQEKI